MRKIVKINNKVIVYLENNDFVEAEVSEEDFERVLQMESDEEILNLLCPKYRKSKEDYAKAMTFVEKIRQSKLLRLSNNVVYWDNVSPISLPQQLAEAILDAEFVNNELKLTTYRNFWTLMSLNPDERCRKNLFWFLQKHGMTIAKCGFFVGYRNVVETNTPGVYTDHYTHKFKIRIGEMVTMDRKKCDSVQENSCSTGLHIGASGWLKQHYCGDTGLACLVNPADVVAVPPYENYGKLRTCAYLPMEAIHYDENEHVIPLDVEDGFDCSYVTKVIYEGIMGTKEDSPYKIKIPKVPGMERESIQDKLLEIAKSCIVNRTL